MKKNRWIFLLACLLAGLFQAHADQPFRMHRYDAFKVLRPQGPDDIVFVGNSITNMHEWCEAFGNANIQNRGVSGAISDEVVANLGSVINGKPGKVFLLIGTNDLGTPSISNAAHVAGNVRTIVKYVKTVSPDTRLYIQSILPSKNGIRTLEQEQETNDSLRNICTTMGATYVDLWDTMLPMANGGNSYSLDGLHPNSTAYRVWCKAIAEHVGVPTTYPDDARPDYCGLGGSYGMRASTMSQHPVKDGDILMIGDETIHGGEWHELLGSGKVKNRGTGWGYPGPGIADITKQVHSMLKGRADNGEPAKVFLYAGTADANGQDDVTDIKARYESLVNAVRTDAPDAEIYIQALLPKDNAAHNTGRVEPINAALKEIADAREKVTFVDIYTPFVKDGVADAECFVGAYLYGKGYARLANLLAAHMGSDMNPLSETEAAERYSLLSARNTLVEAISSIGSYPAGNGVGKYPKAVLKPLKDKEAKIHALLGKSDATAAEVTSMVGTLSKAISAIKKGINLPRASTAKAEHWYQLFTPARDNRYLTSNGATHDVTGNEKNTYARSMWKFVKRTDGSFDIVNRADKTYLSPASDYSSAIKTSATSPSAGWTLSHSDTPGTFIISSGTVQLNQTHASRDYLVLNWSAGQTGQDRTDPGCCFTIADAGEPTD